MAMAATHGAIGSFDGSQEHWLSYVSRLQNYFVDNDIADDKVIQSNPSQCLQHVYLPVDQEFMCSY